jgi:hypothetical protein
MQHAWETSAYRILVRKREGKKPLERPRNTGNIFTVVTRSTALCFMATSLK